MQVYLCSDFLNQIKQSGVGRAIEHQQMALNHADVAFTLTNDEPYDLIHINTIFPQSYMKAIQAKKDGKKVVYHAHSTKEDFKNSFMFSNTVANGFGWWIKHCYNTADFILTPSEYSKTLLENYGIEKPIQVLSNGIDLQFWQSTSTEVDAFRKKYHIEPNEKLILSVGLQIKRKGILEFVEMAKQLPDYQFIWFGYSNPKLLPNDVVLALETKLPNLQFPGFIERDELRVAYQACDLYVFLTHEETEGIVLLEALASKTDTIVRDIPVFNPDYMHGEQVYKGDNTEDFIRLTKGLLDGQLPSLVEKGYEAVKKKSLPIIGQQLKEVYQYVLSAE